MEAYKIFSKLNIRDYNNELEKILDDKLFSLDVKNLLLSMLYKIENAYKDYKTIKVEVVPKRDFLIYLLSIIKEKCSEIQFIKLDENETEKAKDKIIVDKKKGKIVCYPNEKDLLSAIIYMGEEEIGFMPKYPYVSEAVEEMMIVGSNMNHTEVIRDFNGWSWDILINEIESIEYNIMYQTLILLKGRMINYLSNPIKIQDIEEEKKKNLLLDQLKTQAFIKNDKFITLLNQIVLTKYVKNHKEKRKDLLTIKKEKEELLERFQNKREFIEQKTIEKKEYTIQIENIDKTINNTELLRKEYTKRNANLPNKEKIFSISHLAERLERERKELLEKIKECNRYILPAEFVKEKGKVEEEVLFLNSIGLEETKKTKKETNISKDIVDFCKEFFKLVGKYISQLEDKNEIKDWIYKIRYYSYLPINNEDYLKDVKELKKDFEKVYKILIKKAQEIKLIDVYTENEELSYRVMNELLQTKVINLENITINCKYKNKILELEYYDGNVLENVAKIETENIKIKKKIKLFI